jgi:uncharacterized protein (TIGR02284 family)
MKKEKGDKCMDTDNRQTLNAQGRAGMTTINQSKVNMTVDLLNDLIVTNRGIINIFHTAVERLDDAANAKLLQGYTEQFETFVPELSNMVVKYGGTPATAADGGSLLKQAWVTLKAAVTDGDGAILDEVSQNAAKVLEEYGTAMGEDLPDNVRDLVRRHMSAINLAHEKLSALSGVYDK